MPKIRLANGPYRGREKGLVDKALTIGRDAEAGIQILDRSASRFHCEIFPVGGMWFVKDLESKNGTFVNDDRLKDEELLRAGDVIRIGQTELVFEPGQAIADDGSSDRITYQDDPEMLSRTLEFRLDDLSDLSEPSESAASAESGRGLRILFQLGRILSEGGGTDAEREARALDCLVQALPAECALIFRRDAGSGKLVPSTVRTAAPNVQPVISRSIVKKTFTENKAVHSANALEDERFAKHQSIVSKGIRSVICVPLAVAGGIRGVLYISRGQGGEPFDQADLEVVTAGALQLGMAQHAGEELRRHRVALRQTLAAMVRSLEARAGLEGAGERCARACAAVVEAMNLGEPSRERLFQAGLLHHMARLLGDDTPGGERAQELLGTVDDLAEVLPLIRLVGERHDGSGPLAQRGDDLDTEARVLAACAALVEGLDGDPARADAVLTALAKEPGLDRNVLKLMQACHAEGGLLK